MFVFQLGPVFTLYITGTRMTYLMDEEDYNKYFMQSQHVDFQKAVHLFVANAGNLECNMFVIFIVSTSSNRWFQSDLTDTSGTNGDDLAFGGLLCGDVSMLNVIRSAGASCEISVHYMTQNCVLTYRCEQYS